MKLNSVVLGAGYPVAFIHGFTQTSRSWLPILTHLHTPVAAQLIDAPGHGETIDGRRNLEQIGHDIVETMNTGILVGYSMGARMALHAALTHSDKIESLCLISGTAGIENDEERQMRKNNDDALADRIENVGTEAFLTEWLSQDIFSTLSEQEAQRDDRLRNTARGLAESLRNAGTGTQESLWEQLASINIPILLIAGEKDTKFVGIARRMSATMTDAELRIMKNVGHTAHLEDPNQFGTILDEWLQKRKT